MGGMSDPVTDARALLAEDPNPETRAELEALVRGVESGDEAAGLDLADRMSGPLEFGTAGLRGRVEAGLGRMNRLAVLKATWVGTHLLDEASRGGPPPRFPAAGVRSPCRLEDDMTHVMPLANFLVASRENTARISGGRFRNRGAGRIL
jgi:hypothetical protein